MAEFIEIVRIEHGLYKRDLIRTKDIINVFIECPDKTTVVIKRKNANGKVITTKLKYANKDDCLVCFCRFRRCLNAEHDILVNRVIDTYSEEDDSNAEQDH